MNAQVTHKEKITCTNESGHIVRVVFDIDQVDERGTPHYCTNVPFEVGIKVRIGQMFNAPSEQGMDNDPGGAL